MTIFTVRASSWGTLFDCAYKFEGIHLLGIKSPSSPRALLGTAIHTSTAAFDAARIAGEELSTFDAAEHLVQTLRHPEFDVDWRGADITPREAEVTGLALHTRYCNEISPRYHYVAVELETKPLEIDCGGGVIVRLSGLRFVALDRFDVLQPSARPQILGLLRTLTQDGDLDAAILAGTMKEPLAKVPPGIQSVWIAEGSIVASISQQQAA